MSGFRRSSRRRQRPRRARIALALGAGLAAALVGIGHSGAQFSSGARKQADRDAPALFQADEVEYDEQLGLTVAKGHVEISQGGQILLADTVSYSQRTGAVTASGNVSLV
jgi:LPS-assembly protein